MIIFKKIHDPENEHDVTDVEMCINYDDISLDDLIVEFAGFLIAISFSPEMVKEQLGI